MAGVGFNPFRQQDRSVVDIALVVGTIVVTLALVLWALLG
jgi:hypothetical protein